MKTIDWNSNAMDLSPLQRSRIKEGIYWATVFGLLDRKKSEFSRKLVFSIIHEEVTRARGNHAEVGPSLEEGA